MDINGAKFQEHCFNISRDIVYSVFTTFQLQYYDITTDLICIIEKRRDWQESPWGKKETMASRPFAKISDQEIESSIQCVVPDKTKTAPKYGMKIFNGKINVFMHLTYNFV